MGGNSRKADAGALTARTADIPFLFAEPVEQVAIRGDFGHEWPDYSRRNITPKPTGSAGDSGGAWGPAGHICREPPMRQAPQALLERDH